MFAGIGSHWRNLRYFFGLSAAFFSFSIGAFLQILRLPQGGLNSIVTTVFYAAAASMLISACTMRMRLRLSGLLTVAVPLLMIFGVIYFFYVHQSLEARIYIVNFGTGIMLVATGVRLKRVAGKRIDHILGWVFLLFGLQHFPRTILSMGRTNSPGAVATMTESPFWVWLNFSFLFFVVLVGVSLVAAAASDIIEEFRHSSITDPLTGLLNRRGFENFARSQLALPNRRPISLILCDIDHFKSINDSYGHASGDIVLTEIAVLLRKDIREMDAAGRLGGEEFALLMTNLGRAEAHSVSERLRQEIERAQFENGLLERHHVTASFGVVEHARGEGLESLIQRADAMLYAAKRGGRNRSLADTGNEQSEASNSASHLAF